MVSLYVPAKTLSGDFFQLTKLDDNKVIGIIGDVAGKGIGAALSVSALKVMYNDGVLMYKEPLKVLKYLNKQLIKHIEDEYVAACCFLFDFERKEAIVVGAGINQFFYKQKGKKINEFTVKGPFLGMFEDSEFDKQNILFDCDDRFYFYTDGLDSLIRDEGFIEQELQITSISELKMYINSRLREKSSLQDDCTFIAIKIL